MNIGRQITESVVQGFLPLTHKQLLEHKTEEEAIGLSWLLRLRWGAVGSQIFGGCREFCVSEKMTFVKGTSHETKIRHRTNCFL